MVSFVKCRGYIKTCLGCYCTAGGWWAPGTAAAPLPRRVRTWAGPPRLAGAAPHSQISSLLALGTL